MCDLKNSQKRSILWVSFLLLDIYLHKTSRFGILNALAKQGYDVKLVGLHSKKKVFFENLKFQIFSIPLRYVPVISPVIFAIITFFLIPLQIVVSKPTFIITEPDFSILGLISAIPFSKLCRVKLILDIRSTPVEVYGVRGKLRYIFFNVSVSLAKRFFDGMTTITPLMKKELSEKFDLNHNFVGIWSSGVPAELFDPGKYLSDGEKLKRKFGMENKFIVFYHGVFSANRGLVECIEAINLIKSKQKDIILFLLGSGPATDELKKLIKLKRLQDFVVIHDPVKYSEVPRYISLSDVGILPLPDHPYWRSQCPLKLLEYLAMEKVVILTDIPAHRSIIGESKCGIFIPSTKPIMIAKAIEYAYHNKERLSEWGKIGRIIVKANFVWDKIANGLDKYLLSIRSKVDKQNN